MLIRIASGVGTGLLWFLVLQALEGLWSRSTQMPPGAAAAGTLVAALLVTVAGTLVLVRCNRPFRAGVCAGLAASIALGVPYIPYAFLDSSGPLIAFPISFGRGLGSISVWATLGLSLALTVRPPHRQATTERSTEPGRMHG